MQNAAVFLSGMILLLQTVPAAVTPRLHKPIPYDLFPCEACLLSFFQDAKYMTAIFP